MAAKTFAIPPIVIVTAAGYQIAATLDHHVFKLNDIRTKVCDEGSELKEAIQADDCAQDFNVS